MNSELDSWVEIADSRIECLQLLVRQCKREKEELQATINRLQQRMAEGDNESQKGLSVSNNQKSGSGGDHSLQMALKTAQLQLNILQRRNIELEEKLKSSIRKFYSIHTKYLAF